MGGHSLAAPLLLTHELWQALAMLCDAVGHPYYAFQELGPLQALQGTLHLCGTTWTRQHLGLESEDMEQPQSKALEQ